jgi:hypothetical protein
MLSARVPGESLPFCPPGGHLVFGAEIDSPGSESRERLGSQVLDEELNVRTVEMFVKDHPMVCVTGDETNRRLRRLVTPGPRGEAGAAEGELHDWLILSWLIILLSPSRRRAPGGEVCRLGSVRRTGRWGSNPAERRLRRLDGATRSRGAAQASSRRRHVADVAIQPALGAVHRSGSSSEHGEPVRFR